MTIETRMEALMVRLGHEIEWDTNYKSEGMDSLDFVELIIECEREFDTLLENDDVYKVKTINDLIGVIRTKTEKP